MLYTKGLRAILLSQILEGGWHGSAKMYQRE